MRLINTNTKSLELFKEEEVPQYAILSHTWGEEEVTFGDFRNLSKTDLQHRKAYEKISWMAAQTRRDGLEYFWVDSCCIDQSNSAELSRAINSMFRWYHDAAICYAYLGDVSIDTGMTLSELDLEVEKSRWFTRGWTLLELIAPPNVTFFDARWTSFGSRIELQQTISRVSGIPGTLLLHRDTLPRFSVAQRLSWAAERETTREEDIAYSLLGIFDVHMPLLYGEGRRAFYRLQQAILKNTDDLSILAWPGAVTQKVWTGSSLAPTVREFSGAGSIVYDAAMHCGARKMSRNSLMLSLPLLSLDQHDGRMDDPSLLAMLPCRLCDEPKPYLGLLLTTPKPDISRKRVLGRHSVFLIADFSQYTFRKRTIEVDITLATWSLTMDGQHVRNHEGRTWSVLLANRMFVRTGQQAVLPTHARKVQENLAITDDDLGRTAVAVPSITSGKIPGTYNLSHKQELIIPHWWSSCWQELIWDQGGHGKELTEKRDKLVEHIQRLQPNIQSGSNALHNPSMDKINLAISALSTRAAMVSQIQVTEVKERLIDTEEEDTFDSQSMDSESRSEDTDSTEVVTSANSEREGLFDTFIDILVDLILERVCIPMDSLADVEAINPQGSGPHGGHGTCERRSRVASSRPSKRKVDTSTCNEEQISSWLEGIATAEGTKRQFISSS